MEHGPRGGMTGLTGAMYTTVDRLYPLWMTGMGLGMMRMSMVTWLHKITNSVLYITKYLAYISKER